jgi:dienelactone hydrolase
LKDTLIISPPALTPDRLSRPLHSTFSPFTWLPNFGPKLPPASGIEFGSIIPYLLFIIVLKGDFMKKLSSLILLMSLLASCAHDKKKENSKKDSYSPIVTFQEEQTSFTSRVHLPKEFKDKIPLVVIVHEWWGLTPNMLEISQRLNAEGYATLPVDLFGNGKTVDNPTEAQALATPFYQNPSLGIARLTKYVEMAKKDPHVDASKVYVIGYCFGGTQALNLARSGADIKGVVSFHGGLTSTLPQLPIKAKVLALNGLADPMVPAKDRQAFEKEMKALKADYKVVNYKGATHAFTNPNATEIGKKYKIPVAYNKKADQASWKELLSFLKK